MLEREEQQKDQSAAPQSPDVEQQELSLLPPPPSEGRELPLLKRKHPVVKLPKGSIVVEESPQEENKSNIFKIFYFLFFIMSKRARLRGEDARRAGLNAWETPEGRRWLLKALNPNDTTVPTTGIPTLKCRNISVLNWQGEYSIDAPETISSTVPSYDSTLFLYQHPLIFGLSASRPTGTLDIREYNGMLKVVRSPGENAQSYSIVCGTVPDKPVGITRCSRYLNNQIDPSIFKKDESLAGRRVLYSTLTQKSRMIYGGATIIPTCSSFNNSGSLAVSQQIFIPRKSTLPVNNNVELQSYTNEDFPDTSDTVQNPQMYYGRYQDGAYIPYKMNEPASMPYVGSEQQITTRSPYYVTGVSFIGATAGVDANNKYRLHEVKGVASAVTQKGITITPEPTNGTETKFFVVTGIRFYIMTFTGQKGYFTVSLGEKIAGNDNNTVDSNIIYQTEQHIAEKVVTKVGAVDVDCTTGTTEESLVPKAVADELTLDDLYIELPKEFTAYQWNSNYLELANPLGTNWISEDISQEVGVVDPQLKIGTIPPFNGQSIITVHTSGVSNTAPIKMILRYGVEILLVAASPYSPFKFMSPRYDESAIKSYARCIRAMKDAYFANAGSVPGQLDYTNKLMTLIENDSADDLNRTLNQGGTWLGVVQ